MEDPWVNAWSDPQKSSSNNSSNPPPTTTWTPSSKFVTDDQADIAAPSWEPDSGTIWDDSPEIHQDLWSRENRVSQLWTTPTLESIGFAKPSQEPPSEPPLSSPARTPSPNPHESNDIEVDQEPFSAPEETGPASRPSVLNPEEEPVSLSSIQEGASEVPGRAVEEEKQEIPRNTSPDPEGFGTFEAAANDYPSRLDPWTPSQPSFPQLEQTEDWGTTWKQIDEDADNEDTGPVDEWELAKRQKEAQDHYVPPELLDSILHQFNEFAGDHWPEELSDETSATYQHNRDELAETLGITAVVDRLVPSDLTLPVPTSFTKTFISKEMTEALKLTRHRLTTRNSPLAIYMNTKGSLSWEASVKSKPDTTEADVVPTGWRLMPKEMVDQQQLVNDTKKKATGGLLSFFGRKSTTNAPTSGSSSPVRSTTPAAASPRSSIASPRPSVDVNLTSSVAVKPTPPVTKVPDAVLSATMPAIAEISGMGKVEATLESPDPEEPVQAPTAVSRFFGRFSRPNRSSSAKSRNSIALSSDDLEFLSDIVPSANDEADEVDQLDALSNMIRAPPVPTKLPPPLAPPPRALPLPKLPSPPSFSSSGLAAPTVNPLTSIRPSPEAEPIESQLFELGPSFSSRHPEHIASRTSPLGTIPPQGSAVPSLPRPLPLPLSPTPATPRSQTPAINPPATGPTGTKASFFDDDDFSDFQTSPATSAPLPSLDSAFTSFMASAPENPTKSAQQPTSFDDFDDFVSSLPPQVPEKPISMPVQPLLRPSSTPSIFPAPSAPSIPSIPLVKSSSPPKQPSLHERRLSKQADSHQRTLSLLEAAAARGKWPAPPSPLPNAIPPPINQNTGPNLFDVFEEPNVPAAVSMSTGSNLTSLSSSVSSPASLVPPPPNGMMNLNGNGNAAGGSSRSGSLMRSSTTPAIPTPLIPTQQPMKPVLPPPSQVQVHTRPQQQWRMPSPPTVKHVPSFTQSPVFGFGNDGSGSARDSRSTTPVHLPPPQQQQKPVTDAFSSLLTQAAPPAPTAPNNSSKRGTGSSGAKLSAQDLSFFESL
ncbi:hypothetical protein P691DRAFT_755451 [Macrolepiota fuliginosa MF-IS2]|uniref:Uncharacterized protein n=1 Tax=Macrolepiota fuliginosa MF-IS2 TaxID=1400762 RepID=A0A9P5XMQ3_9AGAR|nr:hypothetical protein P691DRAFT_755451 [Macrolepiota fuliginosa MF-IS2]